MYRA
ncbi:hypothetical protein D018_4292A, partial [Vibrio parahaemolyticus VP2007-007]